MIRYCKSKSTDPFYNLALEEYLFENKKLGEIVIFLWQNDNTVVIGRYQNAFEEVDLVYAKKNGIRIVRRNTGGGAVYHDLGNLNYSFIVDSDSSDLNECTGLLGSVLNKFGLKCKYQGRNDIMVNGYKVSGTAQYFGDGKLLHHGTLLVNSDLTILERVLTRNAKITRSIAKQSLKSRISNMQDLTDKSISIEAIIHAFDQMIGNDGLLINNVEIDALTRNKYSTDEWNYGFIPKCTYKKMDRFKAGAICISAFIEDATISEIAISGDFFTLKPIGDLEQRLVGTMIDRCFCELDIDISDYIRGLSTEEFFTLFDGIIK